MFQTVQSRGSRLPKGGVRAIKFTSIDESCKSREGAMSEQRPSDVTSTDDNDSSVQKSIDFSPKPGVEVNNWFLGRKYAATTTATAITTNAVELENVCFNVDKSQQQANFIKEVLFKLSTCANSMVGITDRNLNQVSILNSVNLNVPHGSIFGLLGPSSCGKTTLLRCLLGLLQPSSGSIRLFGKHTSNVEATTGQDTFQLNANNELNSKWFRNCLASGHKSASQSKVPGANVGYMPQDLGLYEDFTIEQLLTMFGRYMRMDSSLIKTRIVFMANFLELPSIKRQIQTLSGGQKRRVSFAIACLHMPPLIILDEPTVGVDPLLRKSIWKYLRHLASVENKTIIITTHYIEEAAQADQVALMRAGRILIQDSPSRIMKSNNSSTLEEAFLKICNSVEDSQPQTALAQTKLFPQPQISWQDSKLACTNLTPDGNCQSIKNTKKDQKLGENQEKKVELQELKLKGELNVAFYDNLTFCQSSLPLNYGVCLATGAELDIQPELRGANPSSTPSYGYNDEDDFGAAKQVTGQLQMSSADYGKLNKTYLLKRRKFTLQSEKNTLNCQQNQSEYCNMQQVESSQKLGTRIVRALVLFWALLYKNYRRNVNSVPLLAFQFMLPMIQMISFSLCVGGRPTNVGLGVVNFDQPISFYSSPLSATDELNGTNWNTSSPNNGFGSINETFELQNESLSLRYLSFIDNQMLRLEYYDDFQAALADVRRAKLWAVLKIGQNFTSALAQRFDLENFYQLDLDTISQSVIRIYPDRSNKILDMICQRSLVDSYRQFLSSEFDHFRRLPIEVARPIFDIKPNVISNSIDGYTESIAPGLLASLTYIMAAGLTTFIMVVERSAGILERTYTSGVNPVAYLLAHAIFRSLVMMLQIAAVLVLTFYILQQPLVGSVWLAYSQLMLLNMTGIAYGLLISSIVTDQNGAALTIVSSLVVKITMSGILWPFEAIPLWLRTICYVQPLTMPVQALKAITLKGATLTDRPVYTGFLVSLIWLIVFLTVSTKRFKFYQH